jgi:hypothetical protein
MGNTPPVIDPAFVSVSITLAIRLPTAFRAPD